LTSQERKYLQELVKKGKVAGHKIRHAKIDQGKHKPAWPGERIAEDLGSNSVTVSRLQQRFVEERLDVALGRRKRQNYTRKLDGHAEAYLIAWPVASWRKVTSSRR
jgi:hypothetical protein